MQQMPHKTWVSIISDHVDVWKRSTGMSRESIAEVIIEQYKKSNETRLPGIKDFSNDKTQDIDTNFEARRVNADRIFRWLDDKSKDGTLLPTNFIPVVLQALPDAVRMHCIDELLIQVGAVGHKVESHDSDKCSLKHLQSLIKESGEANNAVAELVDGETTDELIKAKQELSELIDTAKKAHNDVSTKLKESRLQPIQEGSTPSTIRKINR